MKIEDVILRAMAKQLRWYEAAEIIGISYRQMRRWKERWENMAMTDCLIDGAAPRHRNEYRSAIMPVTLALSGQGTNHRSLGLT